MKKKEEDSIFLHPFANFYLFCFVLQITYNKNIFVLFYENGLMTSFDHLSKDLTSLLSFLVSKVSPFEFWIPKQFV